MTKLPCRRALELYIKLSLILTVTLAVVIRYDEGTKISKSQVGVKFRIGSPIAQIRIPDERIESVSTPTLTEI